MGAFTIGLTNVHMHAAEAYKYAYHRIPLNFPTFPFMRGVFKFST